MGDFNARTSTVSDLVAGDKCDRISPLRDVHLDENVLCRNSEDQGSRVCSHGNQLLEMCRSANLKISNGRTVGDQDGRYTCHTYNGSSLVDYILVSGETLEKVRYLKVKDLIGTLTDHCLVSMGIAMPSRLEVKTYDHTGYRPVPSSFSSMTQQQIPWEPSFAETKE